MVEMETQLLTAAIVTDIATFWVATLVFTIGVTAVSYLRCHRPGKK